ncbi:cytidylyltransferase domain-containing protein [Campylobacter hyointestinalis]|uniref:cytidylyltransferase domain-containing protein n=1 Tax=Campylobacter hyointestinalis TaxID=198 RepID=UPI0009EF4A74|nr:hypothetical protein [Campylobacter hyointestinalis]
MNNIAIITARGGSKRIPRKNIVYFLGLISYAIDVAKEAEIFDEIIVSTDDEMIANIAMRYGANVPNLRPKELSDDFTSSDDVEDFVIKAIILPRELVCDIDTPQDLEFAKKLYKVNRNEY